MIKLDDTYYCSYVSMEDIYYVNLRNKGETIVRNIDMVSYFNGRYNIHCADTIDDMKHIWMDIKKNMDRYDYVCVSTDFKDLDRFKNILEYLRNEIV